MKKIQIPQPVALTPGQASDSIRKTGDNTNTNSVVGYKTKGGIPALLVCVSKGRPRDERSEKPFTELWGFTYLSRTHAEMTYMRKTAKEAIEFAIQGGAEVCLWDNIFELLTDFHRENLI